MYPNTFFREKRLPIGASESFKLCSLEWLRGTATYSKFRQFPSRSKSFAQLPPEGARPNHLARTGGAGGPIESLRVHAFTLPKGGIESSPEDRKEDSMNYRACSPRLPLSWTVSLARHRNSRIVQGQRPGSSA
jgi:hypothetical protein